MNCSKLGAAHLGWAICLVMICYVDAHLEPIKIDEQSVIFLYESRVSDPVSKDEIAKLISSVYRDASDEFQRYELMEQIAPIIEQRMAEAAAAKSMCTSSIVVLQEYDFDRQGFPTGLGENARVLYGNEFIGKYALGFENGEVLGFLPVEFETARTLSGILPRDRRVGYHMCGDIAKAERRKFRFWSETTGRDSITIRKTVIMRIMRIEARLQESGQSIGVVEFE